MRFIKNNKYAFSLALLLRESRFKSNVFNGTLDEQQILILNSLKKDGIAILPNYFSANICDELSEEYSAFASYSKKTLNDERIWGIEQLSEKHKTLFHNDNYLKDICSAYVGDELIIQTTMAARLKHDPLIPTGSGGGWHRDSYSKQIKALAYLSDVTSAHGPFQYIPGSQEMRNLLQIILKLPNKRRANDFRYSQTEIDCILELTSLKIQQYPGTKGTVILVDTRGLHTGSPISTGERRSVFNYYIAKKHYNPNSQIVKMSKQHIVEEHKNV